MRVKDLPRLETDLDGFAQNYKVTKAAACIHSHVIGDYCYILKGTVCAYGRASPGDKDSSSSSSSSGAALSFLVHALLLLGPQLTLQGWLASVLVTLALLGASIAMLLKMLAFRRWNDELANMPRFGRAVVMLLLVVTVENFATWSVAGVRVWGPCVCVCMCVYMRLQRVVSALLRL